MLELTSHQSACRSTQLALSGALSPRQEAFLQSTMLASSEVHQSVGGPECALLRARRQSHAGAGPRPAAAHPQPPSSSSSSRRPGTRVQAAAAAAAPAEPKPDPFATKEVYHDGFFSKFMIDFFSKKMSEFLGGRPYEGGYAGFVDLSREIMKGRSAQEQQQAITGVLSSLMPDEAAARFRRWFPLTQWGAELNAVITTLFFGWLVGPLERKEVEVPFRGERQQWRSGVQIKKCRYLEESACVGMCVNMCKLPTQSLFTDSLGMPLTMKPNFEDLSCEMIFGQPPPPQEEDEAFQQPCFAAHCRIADESPRACPRIAPAAAEQQPRTPMPLPPLSA